MTALEAGWTVGRLLDIYERSGYEGVIHWLQDTPCDELTEMTAYLIGYIKETQ